MNYVPDGSYQGTLFSCRGMHSSRRVKYKCGSLYVSGISCNFFLAMLTVAVPGSSGSWVVRGSRLLGQIIAVYDGEPYAHMMPIGEVTSGIKAAFGSAQSPEVSLQIRTNSSIRPIDGEENAPSLLEDDELFYRLPHSIPCREDHQESRSGFTARLKAAGSTVANHFTYIFRGLSKFTKARIRFAVFEPLPRSESFDLFEKYKRESKARKAATVSVPYFLRHLAEAAAFLLLFFPRLALKGAKHCFGRFSSRWLRSLLYAFILLLSVASWSIVAFATAHLAPTLKASEVPIDLLVLSIASSSLGTLLMTWALGGIPSLFPGLARRKVEREMRLFACSEAYELETDSQICAVELQTVHKYLWLKYCAGLDSGNGISRRMHHFERMAAEYTTLPLAAEPVIWQRAGNSTGLRDINIPLALNEESEFAYPTSGSRRYGGRPRKNSFYPAISLPEVHPITRSLHNSYISLDDRSDFYLPQRA